MNDMVAIQVGQGSSSKVYYVSLALLLASGLTLPAGASISLPSPDMVKMMAAGVPMPGLKAIPQGVVSAWSSTDSTGTLNVNYIDTNAGASPATYWELQRTANILNTSTAILLGGAQSSWTNTHPGDFAAAVSAYCRRCDPLRTEP